MRRVLATGRRGAVTIGDVHDATDTVDFVGVGQDAAGVAQLTTVNVATVVTGAVRGELAVTAFHALTALYTSLLKSNP